MLTVGDDAGSSCGECLRILFARPAAYELRGDRPFLWALRGEADADDLPGVIDERQPVLERIASHQPVRPLASAALAAVRFPAVECLRP
jgi:hypothetical protein